ncbi:MAG: cytochrome c maturation protein CcmE [Chloroflexi bacterium]|nr:cytochrome c maturation protein CcmE [Chloroflexota bacterium]
MLSSSATGKTVGVPQQRSKSTWQQRKFFIGGAIVLLAIGYLMYSSLIGSTVYYLTPTELKGQVTTVSGQNVRLGGNVVDSTIKYDPKSMVLNFDISDEKTTIPVAYKGVVPDAFKQGVEVVVEGKLTSQGVFEATTLLAKCPSKYVPEV